MSKNECKPLSTVPAGKKVKLVEVHAGYGLKSRLSSMGLTKNIEFEVIHNRHPGPFVVNIRGTRVMLGRGMAEKIFVK